MGLSEPEKSPGGKLKVPSQLASLPNMTINIPGAEVIENESSRADRSGELACHGGS